MKQNRTRILLRILPLLWMAFIWSNSMKPAAQSSAQSMGLLDLLGPLVQVLPDWLALHAHHILRKLAHAVEFALLGTLWYMALSTRRSHAGQPILPALLISACTAAIDESIQLFRPGRSGQLSDVCLDTAGALLAILLCAAVRHLWNGHQARRTTP